MGLRVVGRGGWESLMDGDDDGKQHESNCLAFPSFFLPSGWQRRRAN